MNRTIKITFITPCFCRGADCSDTGAPEIRPASIRGQLHWWFRVLGGTSAAENAIFGSVHGNANASKVVIRVKYSLTPATTSSATLPHKTGGHAATKQAIAPGTSFDLLISTRLGGLSPDLEQQFSTALDAWLLLGALGLRATRGGGNFTFEGQPDTPEAYANAILGLPGIQSAILDKTFTSAEAARRIITDTIAHGALARNSFPLGAVRQGQRDTSGAPRRKTSPLRFRIIKFADNVFRIIAIWDTRHEVTGNNAVDLRAAIVTLRTSNKEIGTLLASSPLNT